MHQSQNQDTNNYDQFRPYSHEHEHEHDNMPMPMKWMMKMMMMKKMKQAHEHDHYNNMDKQPYFQAMQNNNANYKKQGMFGNLFENIDSDMDFRDMFSSFSHSHPHRHSRALGKDLDLGDRLVEKLHAQKLEMEEKVGNLTCVLKEMNVLNAKNEISAFAMKKDLEQYNLPSVWFKENQEALIDTCYEMATTLPAEMQEGYIVEASLGRSTWPRSRRSCTAATRARPSSASTRTSSSRSRRTLAQWMRSSSSLGSLRTSSSPLSKIFFMDKPLTWRTFSKDTVSRRYSEEKQIFISPESQCRRQCDI